MTSQHKYEELLQEPNFSHESPQQRGVGIICEIIQAAAKGDMIAELLAKAIEISKSSAQLSSVTVFQIAGDEIKVEEVCNKVKH
jgi:hypothetical protein